ncbi:Phosphoenolpyruvate-dependent sugar phosphotransferase system, EIIA 2 [Acididesulfobacillus acetoxydans]|uniref:Ascorbate-specific PTS system EIIA component n=1 Tax=Acididesulfobacillus acetoxydans TaxID=1561005 RepID=A0A8S0Y0C3_9FIRM|nr:PTS sugar transporter subunit IIA [Acididesulfobacillus acetoxydans]CAA7603017.1 Phosphoenolpyruvate-dependent sugar phosphotransferase system, EIIA 2 [Acididesulfobacillus acetoxydans]CEJ08613.1 Phosphotransferase/anion transporter [Acididesulfobacillus acetoxydans]
MKIIAEERVRLKATSRDWEDALAMSIQLLVDNGYVELAYIQATINAVKDYGPYIVLAPGIAFAHAKPTDGVKSTGISLLTLEKAVYFGHQDNDPVDIVFGIAALEFNLHVEIMRKLATFLSNAENINFIRNATNVRDIVKRINE